MIKTGVTNSYEYTAPHFPVSIDNVLYPNAWYQPSLNQGGAFNYDGYIAHFSLNAVVGIEEYYKDKKNVDGFGLFPNPAQTEVNLAFKGGLKGNTKIEIYNQLGQLIFVESAKDILPFSIINIGTHGLSNGLYIVNVVNNENTMSKKLIIAK